MLNLISHNWQATFPGLPGINWTHADSWVIGEISFHRVGAAPAALYGLSFTFHLHINGTRWFVILILIPSRPPELRCFGGSADQHK